MIKVSDYIINFLVNKKITRVFLISGGGNIHLIDSVGKGNIAYTCNYHEQACATAAEGYARITGNFGVCIVTTGPGGTNAITGVLGAWLDSIPILVISGQVRTDLIGAGTSLGVRQLGDQEINIVDIVSPITKYAVTVKNPSDIRFHLEKALYIAKSGRPGPVWIDIPLDVQGAYVEESKMKKFIFSEVGNPSRNKSSLPKLINQAIQKIIQAERPVLYAGNGIRLAGAEKEFSELVDLLQVPVLTSYAGYDLIASSHKLFYGRAHAFGQRSANFILQNSDLLLAIGTRLDIRTIGFTYKAFARGAYQIMVDIDRAEIEKPILDIDLGIQCDAKLFIEEMLIRLKKVKKRKDISAWLTFGKNIIEKYPNIQPKFWNEKNFVNPYCFIDTIGKFMREGELIVLSDGVGPLNCSYQSLYVKKRQRVILNNGCAQMGYGLPAAIGVCFGSNKKRVICFEGDGSLQLNIHELQVVKHNNLPIKIFVFSNDGYQSIRNTQKNLFEGRFVASDSKSGVSSPDFVKLGKAYGIKSIRINNHQDMERKIIQVFSYNGPVLCDINTVRNLMLTPKLMTKKTSDGKFISPPLEDMWPFLPRKELKENMLIPLWES